MLQKTEQEKLAQCEYFMFSLWVNKAEKS